MSEHAREPDRSTERPDVVEMTGAEPGPTITVLGGVHGDELEGVLAARRLRALLTGAGRLTRGAVRIAAPAHPAAWAARTRLGPADGTNLARVFPGDPAGGPTERVAAALTATAISGADLLIDLHSAGSGFDMPLLVGYEAGDGEVCRRSAEAAETFGAPLIWEHPVPLPGRSLSAAAELGVPSIYVEGRGGGQVRQVDLDCYVAGLLRILHGFGMVTDVLAVTPDSPVPLRIRGAGDTDGGLVSPANGYVVTAHDVGDEVEAGAVIAEILGEDGVVRDLVRTPAAGVVMLLRRDARTRAGDTVAIVAGRVGGPDA